MSALKRLDPTDERLRIVCNEIKVSELRLKKTQKIIDRLLVFVFARNNKGAEHDFKKPTVIGLSANQVGIQTRVCIVDLAIRRKNQSEIHVMINPHITWMSKTMSLRREGCVNLPDIWGFVPRSTKIDVVFYDRWGNSYKMRATGWAATLIQHEVDHLDGKLFVDRLSDPTKALHVGSKDFAEYKKNPKEWKKFIDVSQLVRKLK